MSMMFSATKIWPLESWRNFTCSLKRVSFGEAGHGPEGCRWLPAQALPQDGVANVQLARLG
eukprot:5718275-Heterocapsa_arctica.AAC.1